MSRPLYFSVAGARRTAPGMHQLPPTWRIFAVQPPEQKQPARVPRHVSRSISPAGSEKIGWPVTALLHEALHLPDIRCLAGESEVLEVGETHAGAQHTGSLSDALTSDNRHRGSGRGWIGLRSRGAWTRTTLPRAALSTAATRRSKPSAGPSGTGSEKRRASTLGSRSDARTML